MRSAPCRAPVPHRAEGPSAMCRDAEIDMAVQVNGKLRGAIHVEADSPDDAVIAAAQADEKVARFLEKQGGRIVKTIVVKNKLVNLIVK